MLFAHILVLEDEKVTFCLYEHVPGTRYCVLPCRIFYNIKNYEYLRPNLVISN